MKGASKGLGPKYLLELSANFLTQRDLRSCRSYALEARDSDLRISSVADQIISIADVLLAAERRFGNGLLDYFSILQVRRSDSGNRELLWTQFEKLATLLNPTVNKFAFAEEAGVLVRDAWSVLSDPEKKTRYESEIDGPEKKGTETSENKETFWTLCPYCYCMYEYEKVYEECCLRCQNCQRAFHGVSIKSPPQSVLVGEENYYRCGWGCFPVGCEKGAENDGDREGKNDSVQGNARMRNVKTKAGRRVMKNVKTVARNTAKIMGRGMSGRKNGMERINLNVECGDSGEDELEFFEGDDDIFVGVVLGRQ
ncbi:uncharacterized protein LOC132188838 [Corylus avellana]|uniref:uncharacterized protein LOC132188838 n=1 Tax=Corylus avellana TaxID=13451 RepID=UPI00286B4226|nr:uncharacterized protein LOC132188838 [Corylus avellana]